MIGRAPLRKDLKKICMKKFDQVVFRRGIRHDGLNTCRIILSFESRL
jgi:hypothetical protein